MTQRVWYDHKFIGPIPLKPKQARIRKEIYEAFSGDKWEVREEVWPATQTVSMTVRQPGRWWVDSLHLMITRGGGLKAHHLTSASEKPVRGQKAWTRVRIAVSVG